MRRMHVAHFESSAIAAQAAWPESGEATLVGQLRQRIGLIHELRKLRATEEIANDCAQRLRVNQLLRRHSIDIDVEQSHAFFNEALGTGETDAALIGQQFANRSHTPADRKSTRLNSSHLGIS